MVLNEIYPQPRFKSRSFQQFKDEGQTDNYVGKKWYLTINLRRLNPQQETEEDDQIVLKLKIKFKLGGDTDPIPDRYIVFDSIPMQGTGNTVTLPYGRGNAQKMEELTQGTEEFLIRRNMLPVDVNNPDITISAYFCNRNLAAQYQNRMFTDLQFNPQKPLEEQLPEYLDGITDIDIEVDYFGHTDIAIDYVRIESINAQHLLRGYVDERAPILTDPWLDRRGRIKLYTDPDDLTKFEEPNDIKNLIQSALDTMKIISDDWSKGKLFRFYYQDIESDKFYWWGPIRYANLVTNGMFMPRDVHAYPKIYEYYTKSRTRWIGTTFSNSDNLMPAAYIRNGKQNWETLGLKFGFKSAFWDTYHIIHFPDSLESEYETALWDGEKDNLIKVHNDDEYYFETLINPSQIKGVIKMEIIYRILFPEFSLKSHFHFHLQLFTKLVLTKITSNLTYVKISKPPKPKWLILG